MSEEDALVNALIEYTNKNPYDNEIAIEPEAHYNHYGTRGVVDLYVREIEDLGYGNQAYHDNLYEVKSANAVQQATGANEIVRQYNRMRKTFYRDDSHSAPSTVQFELVFVPSQATVKHVADNIQIYEETSKSNLFGGNVSDCTERVFFRAPTPDNITPVHIRPTFDGELDGPESWAEGIRQRGGHQHPCGQKVLEILEEIYNI